MRKIILYFILLLGLSSLSGIGLGLIHANSNNNTKENKLYSCLSVKYDGFDEVLNDADLIIEGKVTNIIPGDDYDEYIVHISQNIKGEGNSIMAVRNYHNRYEYEYNGTEYSGVTCDDYEEGKDYVFVLQHIDNVYDEKYIILSDTYIPTDTASKSTVLSKPIECNEDPYDYVYNYKYNKNTGKGKSLSIPYIVSSSIDEIVDNSQYIAEIGIDELYLSSDKTDVYLCSVIDSLSGHINTNDSNQILVVFFKNTVNEGEKYIIMLNSDTNVSLIYSLSSANSVKNLKEKDKIVNIINSSY